jgi:histidyl-tRNA synthetase
MATFQGPRGTRDFLPDEMAVRNTVERAVRATFESYGYQQIQTPTFELYDLFAARSGEEIRESMFTFASDAGRYALRPELTAPVCRLVANGELNRFPKPYKLYYFGPCFRYCRPQQGRYREFVQTGVELMGTRDPLADAEVIAVAVRVLANLGLDHFALRVGDVGVFRSLLGEGRESQQQERQNHIIADIDRLMHLGEKCQALVGRESLAVEDRSYVEAVRGGLARLQAEVGYTGPHAVTPEPATDDKLRQWLRDLPAAAEETYQAAWVHHRLLPADAAALLVKVARMRGPAVEVIREARALLAGTQAMQPLDDLEKVCDWLGTLGVAGVEAVLGMARNLDFYTGMVFEVDAPQLGAHRQVCGGGRYDRLVEEFGGPPTPATGFAFGFDRLVAAYRQGQHDQGRLPDSSPVDVLVVSLPPQRRQAALVAEQLRARGVRAGLDLRGVGLEEQVSYFWDLGASTLVTVGLPETGEDACQLQVRAPGARQFASERVVKSNALADEIHQARKG